MMGKSLPFNFISCEAMGVDNRRGTGISEFVVHSIGNRSFVIWQRNDLHCMGNSAIMDEIPACAA